MIYVKTTPAPKGHFKCFRCHVVTRSKDGAWREGVNQQVFICKTCDRTQAFQESAAISSFKHN